MEIKHNPKYVFLILFFTLLSCYNQKRNCTDFKNGKFEFSQEIDGKTETSTFERIDSIQIETFRGKTDTSTVRWINNCEFVLQKLHPKNREERKGIHMKILTTQADSYIFEYSFVGETLKQKGTATRIKI